VKPRLVSRFDMLPIRWRLAVTSAILTFVILLTFGLVIAFFTERQMENDFNDEVKDNATRIQQRLQEQVETTVSGYRTESSMRTATSVSRRRTRPISGRRGPACRTSATTASRRAS
jgi:CHASE1-domain containing sensor protein